MSFFSGKSEQTAHETRRSTSDPNSKVTINGHEFNVIIHEDDRMLKVRLDAKGAAKLNAKPGDAVTVGDALAAEWRVDRVFATAGGAWVWLEG